MDSVRKQHFCRLRADDSTQKAVPLMSFLFFSCILDNERVEELLQAIKQKSVTLDTIRHNPHPLCRSPAAHSSGQFALLLITCMHAYLFFSSDLCFQHTFWFIFSNTMLENLLELHQRSTTILLLAWYIEYVLQKKSLPVYPCKVTLTQSTLYRVLEK